MDLLLINKETNLIHAVIKDLVSIIDNNIKGRLQELEAVNLEVLRYVATDIETKDLEFGDPVPEDLIDYSENYIAYTELDVIKRQMADFELILTDLIMGEGVI